MTILKHYSEKTRTKLKKKSSTLKQEASSNQEDHRSFIRNLSSKFEVKAHKSISEFSAPTTVNVCTGPAAEIDDNFELKPGLIKMVQSIQLCGKAHEDASNNIGTKMLATLPGDLQHIHHIRSPQRCYTTLSLPILTVRESEAVVLRYKREEYYVGTLFHELSR